MANKGLIALGLGAIGVAIAPTPDDITIVSPLAQLVVGGGLIIVGLLTKDK